MMYRYFSWIVLLISVHGMAQLPIEASIKVNQGKSFLNSKPTDLPFLIDEDDDWRNIYFYNESVTTKNLPGFELYWGLKMHSTPIIFGMSFALNTQETYFNGVTEFSDGTQNGIFALDKRGVIFSTNYRLGYRHNGFKTIRPYAYVDIGLMNDYSDKIFNTNVTYDGFDGPPDLNLYSSIEIKRRIGISVGMEWRDLAFSVDFHRMKEQLVYDGEGKDLPYNKRRVISFGVSYIIKEKIYKSKADYHQYLNTSYTKEYELVKRLPKYFTVFGGISANISQGGFGISNSSILDADYNGSVSFMKVSRVYEEISTNTTKEVADVAVMVFDKYSSENQGIPRFTLGSAFHLKQLELDFSGQFFKLNNRQHYDYSYEKYQRYIVNGNPQDYTVVPYSFNYDYEFYLNNDINVLGYTIALKYKVGPNENRPFSFYLGFGYHTNFLKITSTNYAQNHPAAVPLAGDMIRAFNGEAVDNQDPSYYNLEDDQYYIFEEEFIELLETPGLRFSPIGEIADRKSSATQKMSGLTFYFGIPVGRFDFHFAYEISKTDDIYLVRSINNWTIGVNYHLWGW